MNFVTRNFFKNGILTLFIGFGILSCKKNHAEFETNCPTCLDEECEDFQWPIPINFETFTTSGPQFTAPFYNPNNSDEFVYVKVISTGSTFYQLVKHVISSGEETILYDEDCITGHPQWGSSGWIIFNKGIGQNNLMKIRPDGTNLQQISLPENDCTHFAFSDSGTRICGEMTNYLPYGYMPVLDLEGNLIDSVNILFGNRKIGFPMAIGESIDNGYYGFYDTSTSLYGYCKLNNNSTITELFTVDGFPEAMCKNSWGLFYVQYQKGLFAYDLATHKTKLLVPNCESKNIRSISISPDGNTILYEKVTGVQTGFEQEIDQQSEIYMINVKTKEKTGIILE